MKKLSQKEFQGELSRLATSLQQQIEAECTGFDTDAKASAQRKDKAIKSFTFFRKNYFPHYCQIKEDSALHTWLDKALVQIVKLKEGKNLAVAAPRGEAKSTFVALFFVLWCVLTNRKRYILIIADALEQASALLEAVKAELEANPRLHMDFSSSCGKGRVWNVGSVVTVDNVKLQALGAGKRMRGLRHGPYRPDLIVLDDLENDENVQKPEQRDKLQAWLQKTVLNLGAADGSLDVVYIGTILHYDSVLARTLKKPLWQGKVFKAVLSFPNNMALWDKWENVLLSEGELAAKAFYKDNETIMLAGSKVSWPAARSLYRLMLIRAENHASFDSEQQNDPLSGDDAPFAKCIHFWVDKSAWLIFGACDPSMGKHGAGRDPSAIVIGGLNRSTMTLDILEASIVKRHPDRIIEDIIAMHLAYKPLVWGVEAIQFQEFFAHVLAQRALERGIALPVRPIINSTDKQLRIETLQPYMMQAKIRLHPSQQTLIDQLRHFPKADHDDGPDALEMLWRLATGGFVSIQGAFKTCPRPKFFNFGDDDA